MDESINKNKLIFLIIGIIFLICILVIFYLLYSNSNKKKQQQNNTSSDFKIWVLNDSKDAFSKYIDEFKKNNSKYKNITFNITSFSNYDEYFNSLMGAFLSGNAPDVFVLNNNDTNFFINQIVGIPPDVISPDEFKKDYDVVFSQDLINKTQIDGKNVDFLIGIPLGYEILGMFYNFRDLKGENLSTWGYINEIIDKYRSDKDKTLIGIGNGSTVSYVSDIIIQFFLLDGMNRLSDVSGNPMKAALSSYKRFGDLNGKNKYNIFFEDLVSENKINLDLFSSGDIQIVLGYPRMLEEIDKRGFNKSFLRASKFPGYTENGNKILINYNYFVINKNSKYIELRNSLMQYFYSKDGRKRYLELFPYYFPSKISLLNDRLEEKLKSGYNIKYKDFYDSSSELTTFNTNYKNLFDKEIKSILDNNSNYIELFEKFKKRVICLSNKMSLQENLDNSCN